MDEPEEDDPSYVKDGYTLMEMGLWVHLLVKRAGFRSNPQKRMRDLEDAQNYLSLMQATLDSIRGKK